MKKFFSSLNFTKITKLYIVLFMGMILCYCAIWKPSPIGEWDDYMIETVTLTHSKPHISVHEWDIERAVKLYPEWEGWIKNNMRFSPYKTKSGGLIPWYFPTYGIACIPLAMILPIFSIPRIYAFAFTNFLVFALMICTVFKMLENQFSSKNRFILILLLTMNPIIFYFEWISAEVFIYSVLAISLCAWYCKKWKTSSFFISLAGSLNPTVMIVGIAIIIDYFYNIFRDSKEFSPSTAVKKNLLKTVAFGCCFLYSLLPFIYGIKACGSPFVLITGNQHTDFRTMPSYFFAYLFDLNFGIFPYYNFMFITALVLFFIALIKKQLKYVFWLTTFFCLVFGYCKQYHINCGMSGIARYNAWSVLIIIFAFCFYMQKIKINYIKKIQFYISVATFTVQTLIVFSFNPIVALNCPYTSFTPIAKFALNNFPFFYNPLHTTFSSRTRRIDGGYDYKLPLIYYDENDPERNIRKILISEKEKSNLAGETQKDKIWLSKKIDKQLKKETYISVSPKYKIAYYPFLEEHDIKFYGDNANASKFCLGISHQEDGFTWTKGKNLTIRFKTDKNLAGKKILAEFSNGVFNGSQRVIASVSGNKVFDEQISGGFSFIFTVNNDDFVDMKLDFPDAIAPYDVGVNGDRRVLALSLRQITFSIISESENLLRTDIENIFD